VNEEERSEKIAELDRRATSRLSEVIGQTQDVLDRMTVTALAPTKRRYELSCRLEDVSTDILAAARELKHADRLLTWDGKSFDTLVFAHLENLGWSAEASLLKELWDTRREETQQERDA
jgi:hypothetical protein